MIHFYDDDKNLIYKKRLILFGIYLHDTCMLDKHCYKIILN